ncbi:MAG: glycosyltransferase family 2 protein, partial [Phyllobacterium sp.]
MARDDRNILPITKSARTPDRHSPDRHSIVMEGEMVVGCPVDDTLVLVMGIGSLAGEQVAAFLNGDPAMSIKAALVSWPLKDASPAGTHGFVAVVPTNILRRATLKTIMFQHKAKVTRYTFASRAASTGDLIGMIGDLAGANLGSVIDGLVEALVTGPIGRRKLAAITVLLQAGARSDGCVELIGGSDEGEIFVQGWAQDLTPSVSRLFISGRTSCLAECAISVFARPDLNEQASGFAGLLLANEAVEPNDIERLLFRGRRGWRFTEVYDRRLIVGARETPSHVRAILPRVRGSSEILLRMRSAANRFDGTETVSSLPFPVRSGIDNVFRVEGSGLLVSGWLLDPDGHVESVKLRRHRGEVPLDSHWTRVDRPDVTAEFNNRAPFNAGLDPNRHAHGFVAFASELQGDSTTPFYLEICLSDERRAFMPLTPIRVTSRDAVVRQIRAIDPNAWALRHIVDQQLVPLLRNVVRPAPEIFGVADLGAFEESAGPALIVGIDERVEEVGPLIALLALDPETRAAPIVIVAAADIIDRIGMQVRRLAEFYKLTVRLVSASGSEDLYDALEVGARAVSADTVVFLAASLLPRNTGWFHRLLEAYDARKDCVLSPTLAYEDDSIRWAGTWIAGGQSERTLVGRYAGYPVDAVAGMATTQVATATFECCVMPREALFSVDGFTRGYLGTHEKGLDLGLKLKQAGLKSYWVPSVQMLGSDDISVSEKASTVALIETIDRQI